MKLLTHNMMQSHVKGITKRFPLLIKPADDGVRIVEQVKFVCGWVFTRIGGQVPYDMVHITCTPDQQMAKFESANGQFKLNGLFGNKIGH